MKCFDIRRMPTTLDNVRERVFRSYHVLGKVKELLEKETPTSVIIEVIDDLQTEPFNTERVGAEGAPN